MAKKRLDQLVHDQYPQYSRTQIQSYIMQGKVLVDGTVVTKSGTMIGPDVRIECEVQEPKYVSRAGFKLEKAIDHFDIDVTDLTVLDAGISTGGFTDCLLQRGVGKVYGIDVGYGQVHEKVAKDPRVVVQERTNLRSLQWSEEKVDLVTLDLSFISVLKVMRAVCNALKDDGQMVVLIKPQFEAGRADVGRGGIIKDPKVHQKVIKQVVEGIEQYGFSCADVIESPILGGSGNKEFLVHCKRIG